MQQPVPEQVETDADMLGYYGRGLEDSRLFQNAAGLLERARTEELLQRFLPSPPAVVIDVGGGTGHYALWLADRGYEVHLIDPAPLHVEQAQRRSSAAARPLVRFAWVMRARSRCLTAVRLLSCCSGRYIT